MANSVGPGLQPQQPANPVAEHNGQKADEDLFQAGRESSLDAFINEAQAIKNYEGAQRGLKKGLGPGGHRFAHRQAKQRAKQDAEGVEVCANHMSIVSRFGRKGNEEKFFLRASGPLDFARVQSGFAW